MSLGNLIFYLRNDQKVLIRKIEKLQRKREKTKNGVIFNQTCLQEDILPKYTNIKVHDPAARKTAFTKEYRRKLVQLQLKTKEEALVSVQRKLDALFEELSKSDINDDLKRSILVQLDESADNCNHANRTKIAKKLSRLYGGDIKLSESKQCYVNLSSVQLTEAQQELLNLGLNCHVQSPTNLTEKKAELELLHQDVLKLEKEKKVEVSPNLRNELIGEGAKLRGN